MGNSENKREQALAYIEALQWILDYYYMGVRSWDWYYPYHYAPFISDLVNIETLKIEFNMGKPFLPFAQLLAVLPAASKKLLPAAYHELMTSPTSELASFYPTDFKTDLNGKQHEWEAVVLIPFIDEKKLLNSMAACESKLEPHERERNTHGPMWQYDYCSESQGSLAAYYEFRMLSHVFCTETPVEAKEITLARDTSVCVELPNLMRHVFYPGFPTFKHLQFDFELKNMRVRVFDFPSRNENVMIKPVAREKHNDLDSMVVKYLDKIVYIGWPHLIKAKVVKISSATTTISNTDEITPTDPHVFQCQTRDAEEHLKTRMGIDVADYDVMLHVQTYEGTNHVVCNKTGKVIAEDIFRKQETVYPVQGVVSDITVHNAPSSLESEQKVDDFFAPNDMVFFIGSPYYGSQGVIIDPTLVYECGRLKVNITVPNEPNFETARHVQSNLLQGYMNLYATADMLGISARCLARITSPMFVVPDKRRDDFETSGKPYRISVELRNPKKVECEGYSRYANSQWFYSSQALELLQDYANRFPQVVEFMSSHDVDGKVQFAAEIFGDNFQQKLDEIIEWQEGQAYTKAERISCGGRVLAKEAILEIMQAVDQLKTLPVKTVKLQVKPHLLLKPDYALPSVYKSKCSIRLFDRVVIVKTTYMVPIGSKGTIIGIYPIQDPNPVRLECVGTVQHVYDVLFDKKLTNGHDIHGIAEGQVYRVPESSLLLIYQQENGYQDRDKYGQGEPQANTNNTFKVQTRQSGANTNANKNGNWKNNNAETSKPVITNWRIAAPAKPTAEEPQEDKGSSRWGFKRPPRNSHSTSQEQDAANAISSATATATADAHKHKNNVDFWTPNEYAAPVNNNSNNNNNNNNNYNNNQNNHNNNNSRGTSNEQVVKPQRNMASASMDLMPEFVKRNPAVVAQSIRECDEKTATLRNLLGIQTTETPCQPMPPTLPYPPQLWRNEARQYSQQQKQQQRQQNQINQERDNNSAGRSWRSGQTTAAPPVANFANFSQMEKLTLGSPTMAPSGVTTTTTTPIQVKKSPKTPKIAAKFDMP